MKVTVEFEDGDVGAMFNRVEFSIPPHRLSAIDAMNKLIACYPYVSGYLEAMLLMDLSENECLGGVINCLDDETLADISRRATERRDLLAAKTD